MNTLLATGIYAGEKFMDNGLRFVQINLPKVGNSGAQIPLLVVPNKAAGETFDVFSTWCIIVSWWSVVSQPSRLQDVLGS